MGAAFEARRLGRRASARSGSAGRLDEPLATFAASMPFSCERRACDLMALRPSCARLYFVLACRNALAPVRHSCDTGRCVQSPIIAWPTMVLQVRSALLPSRRRHIDLRAHIAIATGIRVQLPRGPARSDRILPLYAAMGKCGDCGRGAVRGTAIVTVT